MIFTTISSKSFVDLDTMPLRSYGRLHRKPFMRRGSTPIIFEKVALESKLITLTKLATTSENDPMHLTDLFNSSISRVGMLEDLIISYSSVYEF